MRRDNGCCGYSGTQPEKVYETTVVVKTQSKHVLGRQNVATATIPVAGVNRKRGDQEVGVSRSSESEVEHCLSPAFMAELWP